ncbi:ribokinase [Actinomyces sp. HMSC08A01]|nr:ribokinase [Actinomyces sp. HMSC08A01]
MQLNSLLETLTATPGKVAVVGSLNADLTVRTADFPRPGQTVTGQDLVILPGGKSANQAVQAGLLGAHVSMVGAVGRDANGQLLLDSLDQAGVDTAAIERIDTPTGTAIITVNDQGENTIVVSPGANGSVDAATVSKHAHLIEEADALGICLEVSLEAACAAAAIARAAGTVVFFNNSPFRPDLPTELMQNVDVLIVNEHELPDMLAHQDLEFSDWEQAGRALSTLGVARAVITLGAEGSLVLAGEQITKVAPYPVNAVDTTGAGDSFFATLLAATAAGLDLAEGAHVASAVSAFSTQKLGAQASYAEAGTVSAAFCR